ncbi:hypothetical protein FRB93_006414 [Tulasnella sp. JGI-2019a]|nr:hypothetical protein FRB93_006414 [Tulasnella sp. JGI-2019a]
MDDVCLIAAPRPLRLFTPSSSIHHHHQHHVVVPRTRPIFSPVEAFAKFSLEDSSPTSAIDENDEHSSIDEPESATSSDDSHTRLSLPEETLEEFLAILRPPTALPPFRFNHPYRRGHGTGSAGSGSSGPSAYPYERPHPYRFRKSVSTISSGATEDTSDTRDRRSRRGVEKLSLSRRSEVDTPLTTSADEIIQAEWRNFELGTTSLCSGGGRAAETDERFYVFRLPDLPKSNPEPTPSTSSLRSAYGQPIRLLPTGRRQPSFPVAQANAEHHRQRASSYASALPHSPCTQHQRARNRGSGNASSV